MAEQVTDGFSIGALAERTGLTPTVLRTWENRFGFPTGTRSASGHRRFTDADVDLVRRVQELRASGMGLSAAVDAVQRRRRRPAESVHAVMARDFPHLGVQRLGRRSLVAASYAVEDEALARAERPLRREWTVVTVSDTRAALVSAWEVPGAVPVYESVVSSHRPAAVPLPSLLPGCWSTLRVPPGPSRRRTSPSCSTSRATRPPPATPTACG